MWTDACHGQRCPYFTILLLPLLATRCLAGAGVGVGEEDRSQD